MASLSVCIWFPHGGNIIYEVTLLLTESLLLCVDFANNFFLRRARLHGMYIVQ